MTDRIPLDASDLMLAGKLDDDYTVGSDGTTATVAGDMKIVISRIADAGGELFELVIRFPSGEELEVANIRRARLLEQFGLGDAPKS